MNWKLGVFVVVDALALVGGLNLLFFLLLNLLRMMRIQFRVPTDRLAIDVVLNRFGGQEVYILKVT